MDKSDDIHKAIREILLEFLQIFFKWDKHTPAERLRHCEALELYLLNVVRIRNSRLRSIIEGEEITDAMGELYGLSTFKYALPSEKREKETLRWLYQQVEDSEIEYNLLRLFEDIGEREAFNDSHILMIEHYLMLNSQINHGMVLTLIRKMGKLDVSDIKNDLELARLNFYGEGIFENIKFSEFLNLNAIANGDWFELSHPFEIKIFCKEMTFDLKQFNVKCTEGLFIVAETIKVTEPLCIVCVRKLNGPDFASVFIRSLNSDPREIEKLAIKPGNYKEDLGIKNEKGGATKPEVTELRERRIKRIVSKGKTLSRTDNGDRTYL